MRTSLETAFDAMDIQRDPVAFYPRKGFENLRGSPTHKFYVISAGRVPGIYTHWHDIAPLVFGFPNATYKKHTGWSEAVRAWDTSRRPDFPDTAAVSTSSAHMPAFSTPAPRPIIRRPSASRTRVDPAAASTSRVRIDTVAASTPRAKVEGDSRLETLMARAQSSALPTPTGTRPLLYMCSSGNNTTIYANKEQASSLVRRGLADGSFRKVEVTSRVCDAFDHAEESALEVYDISDISDEE
ncbi:hypothetical protein C8R45DRAFT_1088484 [Mycena sanguinolenta]|nr:hypothetical protein C8R45DRAFT_1088484 [Mycena sanguinolenta]